MLPKQTAKSSTNKVKGKILVVEDDDGMRFFLSEVFEKEGFYFQAVKSGEEALKLFKQETFDLVVLDYNLPDMNGMETFVEIRKLYADMVVILITAFGSKDLAIEAMEQGVFDYFNKPLEIGELRVVIRRGLERASMQREVHQLRSQLEGNFGFDRIIGNSKAMGDVIEWVQKVAGSDVSVLIPYFGKTIALY
jgi:two-component system, NtrC family, response regulator AtoC